MLSAINKMGKNRAMMNKMVIGRLIFI